MSFDDHQTARPTAQQTVRCTPGQIRGARAACDLWVRRHAGGDPAALRELLDELDLWPIAFHAVDWFTITGRGPCAVITEHGYDDPRLLCGHIVAIDGVRYTVRGVETQAVMGSHRGRPISLLVDPLTPDVEESA